MDLESDQRLQDLVLSVHHAINHAMNLAGIVKIVENSRGSAFVRRMQQVLIAQGGPGSPGGPPQGGPGTPLPQPGGPPARPPAGNRQQRRAQASKKRRSG